MSLQYSRALLIPLLNSKLEPKLSREWEIKTAVLPSYVEFRSFILLQSETLDIIIDLNEIRKHFSTSTSTKLKSRTSSYASVTVACPVCKGGHLIYQCNQFLKQDSHTRIKTIKSLSLCTNFPRKDHGIANHQNANLWKFPKYIIYYTTILKSPKQFTRSNYPSNFPTNNKLVFHENIDPWANFVAYSRSLCQ